MLSHSVHWDVEMGTFDLDQNISLERGKDKVRENGSKKRKVVLYFHEWKSPWIRKPLMPEGLITLKTEIYIYKILKETILQINTESFIYKCDM